MFDNNERMINVNMDYQRIQGETLKALWAFSFSYSDTISLSQSHNIGMTKEEADKAVAAYNENLRANGIYGGIRPTAEEMLEFYKDIAETEEELKEMVRRDKEGREKQESYFQKSQEEVASYIRTVFSSYKLMDRDVTCMTPCTSGGPHVMYYLEIEENIKAQFYQMEDLFQPVITCESMELLLDDPTLYSEGKIVLMVCSHEKYASLFLKKAQYEEFKKLNIPHKVV